MIRQSLNHIRHNRAALAGHSNMWRTYPAATSGVAAPRGPHTLKNPQCIFCLWRLQSERVSFTLRFRTRKGFAGLVLSPDTRLLDPVCNEVKDP